MTLSEHIEELRSRLIRSLLATLVGFVATFIFIDEVIEFFRVPLKNVEASARLIQTSPGEVFIEGMKIAFFAGLILASPYILHHIWAFVAAGLYQHERRTVKYYAVPGFVLFLAGAALAYWFILPWALKFLMGFAQDANIESYITLGSIVSLIAWSMFVFGLVFQLPLIMVFLMRIGVVEPDTFRRYRRHSVVASFAVAMVLTPPDIITQIAMASCMTLLYESAILIGSRLAQPRQTEG